MAKLLALLALTTAAACGGSDGAPPDPDAASPDAIAPDAEPPGANQVVFQADNAAYLAYRNGAGAWQKPKHLAGDQYAMYVDNDYQFIVVCTFGASGSEADWFARTIADTGSVGVGCGSASARIAPASVTISGEMVQPGTVRVGWSDAQSASGPWTYAITTPPGTDDVFATDDDHVALRRALSLTADTALDSFDLTQEGSAFDRLPLTLDGLAADDSVSTDVEWSTGNGGLQIAGTATTVVAPPASLVEAGDNQSLEINASGGEHTRVVAAALPGSTTLQLMPILDGVTFESSGARWTTLPDYDELDFTEYATSGSGAWFSATPSWIAATHASQVGFDAPPSDYDPAWLIDPGSPHSDSFMVSAYRSAGWLLSQLTHDVGGTSVRLTPVPVPPGAPLAAHHFALVPR